MDLERLQGKDYEEIEEIVNSLFEDLGFESFPVDIFDLANKLNIDIEKYTDINPENQELVEATFEDGCSIRYYKNKYIIYYNDTLNKSRMKFTLWYEIGHIQLGHFDNCNKTQARMKHEANYFARYAQAPMPFIIKSKPSNEYEIAADFNVSLECASICFGNYEKLLSYESLIKKNLNNRILKIMSFPSLEEKNANRNCC